MFDSPLVDESGNRSGPHSGTSCPRDSVWGCNHFDETHVALANSAAEWSISSILILCVIISNSKLITRSL